MKCAQWDMHAARRRRRRPKKQVIFGNVLEIFGQTFYWLFFLRRPSPIAFANSTSAYARCTLRVSVRVRRRCRLSFIRVTWCLRVSRMHDIARSHFSSADNRGRNRKTYKRFIRHSDRFSLQFAYCHLLKNRKRRYAIFAMDSMRAQKWTIRYAGFSRPKKINDYQIEKWFYWRCTDTPEHSELEKITDEWKSKINCRTKWIQLSYFTVFLRFSGCGSF